MNQRSVESKGINPTHFGVCCELLNMLIIVAAAKLIHTCGLISAFPPGKTYFS